MNPDPVKQNKMLKQYVEVLERENNSRNIEKDVLLREIDNLTHDNEELRGQLARAGTAGGARGNSQEIEALARAKKDLEIRFAEVLAQLEQANRSRSQLEATNSKLKIQLQNTNNRLTATQSTTNARSTTETELTRLKAQHEQLRTRTSTLASTKQKQLQDLQSKNRELKQLLTQSEQSQRNALRQIDQKQQEIRRLEAQAQQAKQNGRREGDLQKEQEMRTILANHNAVVQGKDRTIGELEGKLGEMERRMQTGQGESVELGQLRGLKWEMGNKIALLEREGAGKESKIKELQNEIEQKTAILNRRQEQQAQLQNLRTLVTQKQGQVSRSVTTIQVLKDNIAHLEKKLQELQQQQQMEAQSRERNAAVDGRRQAELQNLEANYQRQIQELRDQAMMKERSLPMLINEERRVAVEKSRENEELKKIIAELTENNNHLLNRLKTIQESQETNQPVPIPKPARESESDLRNVVQQLRRQLRSVKSDFKKIQQDNKKMENFLSSRAIESSTTSEKMSPHFPLENVNKSLHHRQPRIPYNFELSPKNSSNVINSSNQEAEDLAVKYSKLRNQGQKFRAMPVLQQSQKSMNRDKWEMLQRRITQLREQNAELKQSLYS